MLLIDAWNLLLAPHDAPMAVTGLDLPSLVEAVGRTRWSDGGVTIVCDGRLSPGSPRAADPRRPTPRATAVQIVYSGHGRSADDVIIHLLARSSFARRCTVVTDDRELGRRVRATRARTLDCATFLDQLARQLDRPPAPPVPAFVNDIPLDPQSVMHWIREFGLDRADSKQPTSSATPRTPPARPPDASAPRASDPNAQARSATAPTKNRGAAPAPANGQAPVAQSVRTIDPALVQLFRDCGLAIDVDDPQLQQWLGNDTTTS